MSDTARFVVIVVAYRSRGPLTGFLDAIGQDTDVLIVNNSMQEDDLADLVDLSPRVTQIDAGGNLGFSAGANLGARNTESDYLIFMNPDTLPYRTELDAMIEVLDESDSIASTGATGIPGFGGGALPSKSRVLVHALGLHRLVPSLGIYLHPRQGQRLEAGWISGSCLAIRRSDFEAVGGFDEDYFVFMSDFDLGRRLVALGRRQVLLGDVVVEHFDGGSSDLPSEWTWEQRGFGWGQYLNRTTPGLDRWAIALMLKWGFVARRIVYTVLRRRMKALEMYTMERALAEALQSRR